MQKQTPAAVLAAFVATYAFVGLYGSAYRADLTHSECVGKTYGTPGCPLKQVSRTCGDGVVDEHEECDNGLTRNGEGNCSEDCLFLACGDGVVSNELGEECEPKRDEVYAIDPVSGELTTELRFMAASCGTTCAVPTCADDGSCSGGCKREFKASCTPSSSAQSSSQESLRGAAPSSTALSSSSVPPRIPRCGDNVKDPGEQCDDGNLLDTDGCTIACKLPRCGDGIVHRGESCDDGNTINDDECTNKCAEPACGDSIVQDQELCDSGGNNSDYLANACRMNCQLPRCGDNVVDNGEECDGGDTCSADCLRVKSFGALVVDTPGTGKVAILLAIAGAFLVFVYCFRVIVKRFVRHVAGEQAARSLDDIPLDEIEMPWHKW